MNTVKSALQSGLVTTHAMLRIQERMIMLSLLRRKDAKSHPPATPIADSPQ